MTSHEKEKPRPNWVRQPEELVSVSPEEFLRSIVIDLAPPSTNTCVGWVVKGDLCLDGQRSERLGKTIVPRALMRTPLRIPPVFVDGHVVLHGCHGLSECFCSATKGLFVEDCPSLSVLSGQFGGNVHLENVGVPRLGADFECAHDLHIENCQATGLLNCAAGGNLRVVNSGVERVGPATRVGGSAFFEGCPLREISGTFGGDVRILDWKRGRAGDTPPVTSGLRASDAVHISSREWRVPTALRDGGC